MCSSDLFPSHDRWCQVIAAWLALGERELPLRGEGGFEGILSSLGLQNDFQEILDRMSSSTRARRP